MGSEAGIAALMSEPTDQVHVDVGSEAALAAEFAASTLPAAQAQPMTGVGAAVLVLGVVGGAGGLQPFHQDYQHPGGAAEVVCVEDQHGNGQALNQHQDADAQYFGMAGSAAAQPDQPYVQPAQQQEEGAFALPPELLPPQSVPPDPKSDALSLGLDFPLPLPAEQEHNLTAHAAAEQHNTQQELRPESGQESQLVQQGLTDGSEFQSLITSTDP